MARVLIVEEDKNLCLLYRTELAIDGHEVFVAHDGESGRRMARASEPDLIVIEIGRHDHKHCIESIPGFLQENKSTPVIVNTGYAPYLNNVQGSGVCACVLKSSDIEPLKGAIRSVLQKKQNDCCGASEARKEVRSP